MLRGRKHHAGDALIRARASILLAVQPARHSIDVAFAPLDRLRVRLLRATMPLSSTLAAAREPRVALIGAALVLLALGACLLAPLWLLALGPIVLGVPHLLADLRYCVVRPGWHRRRALWLTAGVPLLALGFGAPLSLGLCGVAASAWVLDGERRRRCGVVGVALALAITTHMLGSTADLIFAHAHNFVAVALWACWRPRQTRLHAWVLGAVVLASVGLMLGLGDGARLALGLPAGLDADTHLRSLAPNLAAPWGLRLVLLYAFAQSVHYGVWLRLIPEDDRPRPTPRSFRASYHALERELGHVVLGVFACMAVGLALWACFDLVEARSGYLRFARFHGMLELTAIGLWLASGRRGHAP